MIYELTYFIIVFTAMTIMTVIFSLYFHKKAVKSNKRIINLNEDGDELNNVQFQEYAFFNIEFIRMVRHSINVPLDEIAMSIDMGIESVALKSYPLIGEI